MSAYANNPSLGRAPRRLMIFASRDELVIPTVPLTAQARPRAGVNLLGRVSAENA